MRTAAAYACSLFSGWIRRMVPRAGLLGSLTAIALVLISFLPLIDIASTPIAMSSSGKTPKTSSGPKNQKPSKPVTSTLAQARKGANGMTRPSNQA